MPHLEQAIAGAFVAGDEGFAYLAVFPDELVVFQAKRTPLRKPKAMDEPVASRARSDIRSAQVDNAGAVEIAFADGASWRFDVASDQLPGAQQIVAELAASGPV
jgi:hypothetical protein